MVRPIIYSFGVWSVYFCTLYIFSENIGWFGGIWKYRCFVIATALIFWWSTRGLVKSTQPKVKTKTVEKEVMVNELSVIQNGELFGINRKVKEIRKICDKNVLSDDEVEHVMELLDHIQDSQDIIIQEEGKILND